jgi:SAM-dependent methyltransferase
MTRVPNFDRVAGIYRWAEYLALGPLLQRTRRHWLTRLQHARHAFLLGDGDGRFLAELFAQNPALTALAVDTSIAMLQVLRRRCGTFATRLQTHHGSALEAEVPHDTDLVVTHFFLDCLTQSQLNTLATRIATHTKTGTLWLVSDFAIPPAPFLRQAATLYIRALYLAFRMLTGLRVRALPDVFTALADAGFERVARHQALFGVLYTELWRRK